MIGRYILVPTGLICLRYQPYTVCWNAEFNANLHRVSALCISHDAIPYGVLSISYILALDGNATILPRKTTHNRGLSVMTYTISDYLVKGCFRFSHINYGLAPPVTVRSRAWFYIILAIAP